MGVQATGFGVMAALATATSCGGSLSSPEARRDAAAAPLASADSGSSDETTETVDADVADGDASQGQDMRSDVGSESPSCGAGGPGLSNCGGNLESCCTSLEVPGGTFDRTFMNTGTGPTGLADPATVSAFRLDKYEVTVGRFRPFVAAWAGGWTPAAGSGKHVHLNAGNGLASAEAPGAYEPGWLTSDSAYLSPSKGLLACGSASTWTPAPASNENLPINCVNRYEAYAFCIYDGGFLPSEAEWLFAAAGGSQQREFPWGATDPQTDPGMAIYLCDYPTHANDCIGGVGNIAPVGTAARGAGRWGQLDLAGGISEPALDWYNAPYQDPCVDCAVLSVNSNPVVRGGSYDVASTSLILNSSRSFADSLPASPGRYPDDGVRCARAPAPSEP